MNNLAHIFIMILFLNRFIFIFLLYRVFDILFHFQNSNLRGQT